MEPQVLQDRLSATPLRGAVGGVRVPAGLSVRVPAAAAEARPGQAGPGRAGPGGRGRVGRGARGGRPPVEEAEELEEEEEEEEKGNGGGPARSTGRRRRAALGWGRGAAETVPSSRGRRPQQPGPGPRSSLAGRARREGVGGAGVRAAPPARQPGTRPANAAPRPGADPSRPGVPAFVLGKE
ncbi:putative Methyltransferase Tarbp1 [Manis pentadactyla]|nr:putative Methyltransferase Tarbp1 [Manis pentadactyla]